MLHTRSLLQHAHDFRLLSGPVHRRPRVVPVSARPTQSDVGAQVQQELHRGRLIAVDSAVETGEPLFGCKVPLEQTFLTIAEFVVVVVVVTDAP